MKTVKIKFAGKWAGITPEQNTICYWLKKNGYDVQVTDDADYIICDVLGEKHYEYCGYPQIRIFESGENITPDFNLVDYAISRYPIRFGDRNFYYPGCTMSGRYWHALAHKDRNYSAEFVKEKEFLANMVAGHDSEYNYRSIFFEKLNAYKFVASAGILLNNMPDGMRVNWLDDSKTDFQRRSKFTICFESTAHEGFLTEKITDAFYADTIPIYFGSSTVTEIFNKDAFINVSDYESLDAVVEKVKELDQDDEKYLAMLRQPILVDPELPRRLDEELEKYILHIFEQPLETAYRRCRAYYPKWQDEFLANVNRPKLGNRMKQKIKQLLGKG